MPCSLHNLAQVDDILCSIFAFIPLIQLHPLLCVNHSFYHLITTRNNSYLLYYILLHPKLIHSHVLLFEKLENASYTPLELFWPQQSFLERIKSIKTRRGQLYNLNHIFKYVKHGCVTISEMDQLKLVELMKITSWNFYSAKWSGLPVIIEKVISPMEKISHLFRQICQQEDDPFDSKDILLQQLQHLMELHFCSFPFAQLCLDIHSAHSEERSLHFACSLIGFIAFVKFPSLKARSPILYCHGNREQSKFQSPSWNIPFPESAHRNCAFWLQAIQFNPAIYQYCPERFKRNKSIFFAINKQVNTIQIPFELLEDKKFLLELLKKHPWRYYSLPLHLKEDRDVLLVAISNDPMLFLNVFCHAKYRLKRIFVNFDLLVRQLLLKHEKSLEKLRQFCPKYLLKDVNLAIELVNHGFSNIEYLDKSILQNRSFGLYAIQKSPHLFAKLDKSLTNSTAFMQEAMKINPLCYAYGSKVMKQKSIFVNRIIDKKCYDALIHAPPKLFKDKQFVSSLFDKPTLKPFIPLQQFWCKDKPIMLKAIKSCPQNILLADKSLQMDSELIMEALKRDGTLIHHLKWLFTLVNNQAVVENLIKLALWSDTHCMSGIPQSHLHLCFHSLSNKHT